MDAGDRAVAHTGTVAGSASGLWLTRLGTLQLIVFAIWTLRTLIGGADFSALAGFVFVLPLWAVVGLLACYHLVRSPALRLRASVYMLAPAVFLVLASALSPQAGATLGAGHVVLTLVVMVGMWAVWRKRTQLLQVGHSRQAGKLLVVAVLVAQAGLSLIWLLVSLRLGAVDQVEGVLRHDPQLARGGFYLWIATVLFGLMVAVYALLGLFLPFGQPLRWGYALQLLMTGVLIVTLIVPSFLVFVVLARALSG